MKRFLDRLQENTVKYPDRAVAVSGGESLTYAGMDEESGKIYAYLKAQGIGREDMVMIQAPRDTHFVSYMIGVWKAGAAFTMVDEGYPPERVAYIYQNTNCRLMLDRKLFGEIMSTCEPLKGYEETDLHDAAYAVYTSGSTGNPKGVLHEFGNLDQCALPMAEEDEYEIMRFGFVPPFSFVAATMAAVVGLAIAGTFYPISPLLLRNFQALTAFIEENELTRVYLPPSYIRIYTNPAPSLKLIDTGSEPANGIYYEGGVPVIHNTYAMSESGFFVLEYNLDKAYDVAPVGRPKLDLGHMLIDDDGNVVEGPGQGELCFKNEYVRGYIGLPEQTAKAFKDGLYHTADICRRDEDGLYYVVGRTDDMIKINGNRIEPAEIEAAVKRCTGLQAAAAKGFSERGRAYIVLYFLRSEAEALGILDGDKLVFDEEQLKNQVPSYMVPTYYVPLKAFPINANGKLARKELKPPVIERDMSNYVAPANDAEKYFCDIMGEVLNLEPFSAADDFFLEGGDSMGAIKLVSACERYGISSKDVYTYRTPQKLAAYCETAAKGAPVDTDDETALERAFPLLDGQRQNIYYQAYAPDSNFLNMPLALKLRPEVDPERLARAVNNVIAAHPALGIRIVKADDGTYTQQYDASFCQPVKVQEISEADLDAAFAALNAPIPVTDSPLYRCGIYRTEKAAYFGFVIHHVAIDGAGVRILFSDFIRKYLDESYEVPKDSYFAILKQNEERQKGDGYKEAQKAFHEVFDGKFGDPAIPVGLRPDSSAGDRTADTVFIKDAFDRREGRTSNVFLTACAIAEAWYNGTETAFVTSIYGSRDDRWRMTSVGYLMSALAVCVDIKPDTSAADVAKEIERQIALGITHTEYQITADIIGDTSDMIRYNYEKDIVIDYTANPLTAGKWDMAADQVMAGSISVNIIDNTGADKLGLAVRYAKNMYTRESIDRFISLFKKAVQLVEKG